jgi:hypothetical protein
MPTALAFVTRYPEFSECGLDPDFISSVLAEAQAGIDAIIYGTRNDAAVMAMAAHLIWVSPAGISLRTDTDKSDGDTSGYLKRFQAIRKEVSPKFAVLC